MKSTVMVNLLSRRLSRGEGILTSGSSYWFRLPTGIHPAVAWRNFRRRLQRRVRGGFAPPSPLPSQCNCCFNECIAS